MPLSRDELLELLLNYWKLESTAAELFASWSDLAVEPDVKEKLIEWSKIEASQADAIGKRLLALGGSFGPSSLEPAINTYLEQVGRFQTSAERLRFNYDVMSVLERPVFLSEALDGADPETLKLFEGILFNEDRILGWCDQKASELEALQSGSAQE